MALSQKHWAFVIGYLVGSFFGIMSLLGLFGGVVGGTKAAGHKAN